MALQSYSVTVPRGQEHRLPFPVARRGTSSGGATGGMSAKALAAIQRAKAYYAPGGGFGKGVEAGLERGRTKAMASGMQSLVGAGLAGTTMAGGLGKKFEEEVAAPTRLNVEEQRAQALSGIEMGQAGMMQGAAESSASRALQMYMADLQAGQNRGTISQPQRAQQPAARQFPSLYNADTGGTLNVPAIPGDVTGTDWETKRFADEAQARKLQTTGRLTFDPGELESTWRGW